MAHHMELPTKKPGKAKLVASKLYEVIDLAHLRRTGRLVPGRSLRFKKVQSLFDWVGACSAPRFFTKGTILQALRYVAEYEDIDIPLVGPFDLKAWVADQGKILHYLCRRAVKNNWERQCCSRTKKRRAKRCAAMAGVNPDEAETQLPEDVEDSCLENMCRWTFICFGSMLICRSQ